MNLQIGEQIKIGRIKKGWTSGSFLFNETSKEFT